MLLITASETDWFSNRVKFYPNKFSDEYQVKIYGEETKRKDIDYTKPFDIDVDSTVKTLVRIGVLGLGPILVWSNLRLPKQSLMLTSLKQSVELNFKN
jgi:hypothetical protein